MFTSSFSTLLCLGSYKELGFNLLSSSFALEEKRPPRRPIRRISAVAPLSWGRRPPLFPSFFSIVVAVVVLFVVVKRERSGGVDGRRFPREAREDARIARGMLSPPSEGVASRAPIPAARKACCVGWLAMP